MGIEEKKDEFLVRYGYRRQTYKELIHVNCCPEITKCQAKNRGTPQEVPVLQSVMFQRWGSTKKKVQDIYVRSVAVYRYRCCHCKRTFRYYPAGSSPADQTKRLELFSILLWILGLSFRSVELILSGLRVAISHMTFWCNVQEENAMRKKRKQWQPVRVVGLDGAYVPGWGET